MHSKPQFQNSLSRTISRAAMLALILAITQPAQAQTYKVIHTFTGGQDGSQPAAGLTMDKAGNFYGTTASAGLGAGGVFKLSLRSSEWVLTPLYSFQGGNDGAASLARVVFGPDGSLYGTTQVGGGGSGCGGYGCGTVFKLSVPPTALGQWTETTIHRFSEDGNGAWPLSEVVFDDYGNLYGTTVAGGIGECGYFAIPGCGVVYSLTPSNNGWTNTVIHKFTGTNGDGGSPWAGVVLDKAGNLYGTTVVVSAAFQLWYSGLGWTLNILHDFQWNDGVLPVGVLTFDRAGNLYGATSRGGSGRGGTVFALSPDDRGWTFSLRYSFTEQYGNNWQPGPMAGLTIDVAGNLYGTTFSDGAYGYGSVFRLTPGNAGWTYTSLHDFCGDAPACSDGANPVSNLVIGASGSLYGTASSGGAWGGGVIFEITQ